MLDPVKVIEENVGALNKVVNKYYFPTGKFDREDLMSEAFLHTVTACQAFDEEKKECKPITFVYNQVDRRVRRFVSKNAYDLNVGEHIQGTEKLTSAVYADRLDREIGSGGPQTDNPSHHLTLKDIIPCSGVSPENSLIEKERVELLHSAIESLSPLERVVILGTWFNDKTQVELAAELGFTKQYISKVEKRGLENLSNKLKSLNVD